MSPPPRKPALPNFEGAAGITVVRGIGFTCQVERPFERSTRQAGVIISVDQTPRGPGLLVTIAHPDGDALTATLVMEDGSFPGFVNLATSNAAGCGICSSPASR